MAETLTQKDFIHWMLFAVLICFGSWAPKKFFMRFTKQPVPLSGELFANQLTHPDWNGFHFYDLIFPLFLFIAGVATPYSVGRELEKGKTRQQMLWRVVKRGLILVVLGIIYNNGLQLSPFLKYVLEVCLGGSGWHICLPILFICIQNNVRRSFGFLDFTLVIG